MSPERNMYDLYRREGFTQVTFDNTGTDTEQLTETDTMVCVDSSLGAGTVYLPPVSRCTGQVFLIIQTGTGTNATTIDDYGGATNNNNATDCAVALNCSINAQYEYVLLFCTGFMWIVISAGNGATVTTPAL